LIKMPPSFGGRIVVTSNFFVYLMSALPIRPIHYANLDKINANLHL